MAHHGYLNLLFVAEVFMIVHLASYKSVGSGIDSIIQKKRASTATERHTADGAT